jgi:hypothetical protein
MYKAAGSSEIIDRVEHIRALHRQIRVSNDREGVGDGRREQKIKDFISNLRRTNARPTVNMVRELEEACSLTTDGAYRLFGYELDGIREFDLLLNAGRTHIVESYVFERDLMVELPLELAPAEAFRRNAALSTLVLRWQSDFPIRALDGPGWRRPGIFYVHIGTEDSLGSSLPPGAMALVEPVDQEELQQPNPRAIYLLQFRNGYRCSRCVVTRGKLQLLTSDRSYYGPQEYSYPTSARIVGRVAAFTLALPLQEYPLLGSVAQYDGNAGLILPWENTARHRLFATKQKRFVRSPEETQNVKELLQSRLRLTLSDRTRRRYRRETASEPHIAALIQMTVEHYARYSDSLRLDGYALRDVDRFSLEMMLRAQHFADLSPMRAEPKRPTPSEVWEARRKEIGEWSPLFSLKFPKPSVWGDRVIRIAEEVGIKGLEPRVRSGSWMLLEEISAIPDTRSDASKHGWSRPLYALRQGLETIFGHLERDGSSFALLTGSDAPCARVVFHQSELPNLHRVCGVLVPV